jgi:D-hydroxyproline dehydrogenase subunit gamma
MRRPSLRGSRMSARAVPPAQDLIRPQPATVVEIEFEGRTCRGVLGQSIAGILLTNDVVDWRTTSSNHAPRGLFCGIGVCFDCVVTVNGVSDIRACQRRAYGGEHVERQHFSLPLSSQER